MTIHGRDWPVLRNVVRQPMSGMTATEIDTTALGMEIISSLKTILVGRPYLTLSLTATQKIAGALSEAAQAISRDWPDEEGVLFILDKTPGLEEARRVAFWRVMNLQREFWGALRCHTVFLLLPTNYRLLLTIADHLADWMSLRLHLRGAQALDSMGSHAIIEQYASLSHGLLDPQVAHQQLEALEIELGEALVGNPADTALLARRYYIPMLQAAVSLRDVARAMALRSHVREEDIRDADLPMWWLLNFIVDHLRRDLNEATRSIEKALKRAKKTGDSGLESAAFYNFGIVAQERRDFDEAEKWYRKSLAINEKLGNEHDAAITYNQLGVVAQERRDFDKAER